MIRLTLMLLVLATPVAAQMPDWKTVTTGVDGVVIFCRSSTRQAFAADICDALSARVASAFEGSRLPVAVTGIAYHGPAEKAGETSQPVREADGMALPLLFGIDLRGTDDANPAIYVGLRVSITFAQAMEPGSILPGIAGNLVIAEQDAVANGPKKQLPAALIKHMGRKADALVAEIRAGL